ncbi:hypothetical protein KP509_26G012700 [Ceratopteris richardii]|uniref:Uncharacterized protein n=1 Tax=Ceratopteris richardii TaxID=49495 RepID=A0A8T2RKV9_CERRI|nr:hypothetical protein KP509_26G012700 [Ceratopteris richardii]
MSSSSSSSFSLAQCISSAKPADLQYCDENFQSSNPANHGDIQILEDCMACSALHLQDCIACSSLHLEDALSSVVLHGQPKIFFLQPVFLAREMA